MAARNNKKKLILGFAMLVAFAVVLFGLFTPLFNGHNGLEYLDALYNSISKASAYYIPQVKKESQAFSGKEINLTLKMGNENQAMRTAMLLEASGGQVTREAETVKFKGDFGAVLASCITDSDNMFHNKGKELETRYNKNGKLMLYAWWATLKEVIKDFNRQKQFTNAKFTGTLQKKVVECAYNYYGITPQNIGDRWGIVLFSLIFYVVYTVWYGYAVMFLFEGAGFQLEAH
ncbi:hypothetical protein [Dethiosulfatarculus sandiegensis]|uniref:Uncharacterized protein n=1 Tax=Dethiosulfatarculus sandiegensis TaxID=1429043 RepID=A0A0D2HZ95_9BACT|nr:hypothetical protein [Dethiosulfatarculus sandiegensis]KIX15568.1 hypothetical protein X474_02380 [Dethiosulfatarculus sandiegensis]